MIVRQINPGGIMRWFVPCILAVGTLLGSLLLVGVVAPGAMAQTMGGEAYRLRVGDALFIQVLGEEELSLRVQLNEVGQFTYPYLGELRVLDKTLVEVRSLIAKGLKGDYLLDPKVNVSVESYQEVYVGGEVTQAGSFAFQPGLTVGKAIVLAGGFTERSAKTRVTVISESPVDAKPRSKRVSLDHPLKPGDVVNVPRRFF